MGSEHTPASWGPVAYVVEDRPEAAVHHLQEHLACGLGECVTSKMLGISKELEPNEEHGEHRRGRHVP